MPVENGSGAAVKSNVTASFENVSVTKTAVLSPGKNEVKFAASEFPQLIVQNPRLWWPNGYGKPELYVLKVNATDGSRDSDAKELKFGIRELTYELGLFDSAGHLRRVEISPTGAREKSEQLVDVTHNGIRAIAHKDPLPAIFPQEWEDDWKSWAATLKPGAERSSAVKPVDDLGAGHYLALRVNGVRIAARGGSWGMDDTRKRVSRERLEPYFRLHRDANMNIIRNWVGQSTEEVFYQLADEYGLLVWNDFWLTTQNYNLEPTDTSLFLDNTRDTLLRFRNHPSIAVWCARNEGVPPPALNEALEELTRQIDGTRYYSPTSNQLNLQNSGPYRWVDPKLYFTMLNHGFSVETGATSFPTLEMWRAWIPQADRWPISDDWAYHDWHQDGNGTTVPLMAEMEKEFGAPTSLEDFERKVQMINYVQHRAIFEGMNAHLWLPNTGRMLWMTQPAWPSSNFQIFSSDYDTHASFYATKHASEVLHVQLDPTTYNVQVVNSLPTTVTGLSVHAKVVGLDNAVLSEHEEKKDAPTGATNAFSLDLTSAAKDKTVLIKLELKNSDAKVVSESFYWYSEDTANYQALNHLAPANLVVTAASSAEQDDRTIHVRIENSGAAPALMVKLTLFAADGRTRVLPAYYSDNYISLLPNESKLIDVIAPKAAAHGNLTLGLRGWNATERTINVSAGSN